MSPKSLKGPINQEICLAFGLQLPIPWGFCSAGAGHMLLAHALRNYICMGSDTCSSRIKMSRPSLIQMPALSAGMCLERAHNPVNSLVHHLRPSHESLREDPAVWVTKWNRKMESRHPYTLRSSH